MVGGYRGRKESQGDLLCFPCLPKTGGFSCLFSTLPEWVFVLKFALGPSLGVTRKIPCPTSICVWPQACVLGQKPWAVLMHTAEGNTQRLLPKIPTDEKVLLIKGTSFPLLTSWHHDIEDLWWSHRGEGLGETLLLWHSTKQKQGPYSF